MTRNRDASTLVKTVGHDGCGHYAEVYTDDDGGSGHGDNALSGRWYGTRAECEALEPNEVELYPVMPYEESPDPFDLACERRFDASSGDYGPGDWDG